jgi:hypothetical protein
MILTGVVKRLENPNDRDLHSSHYSIKPVHLFESELPFSLTALQESTLLLHPHFYASDIPSFNLLIRVIHVVLCACSNQVCYVYSASVLQLEHVEVIQWTLDNKWLQLDNVSAVISLHLYVSGFATGKDSILW